MGHNYSKHFNNKHNEMPTHNHNNVQPSEEVVDEVIQDTIEEPIVEENTANVIQSATGVVSGCEMLNVRKENDKNAEIIFIINKDSEVQVDLSEDKESDEFYKVVTPSGVEGYCMKKFITLK